jgi:hypothetical protein
MGNKNQQQNVPQPYSGGYNLNGSQATPEQAAMGFRRDGRTLGVNGQAASGTNPVNAPNYSPLALQQMAAQDRPPPVAQPAPVQPQVQAQAAPPPPQQQAQQQAAPVTNAQGQTFAQAQAAGSKQYVSPGSIQYQRAQADRNKRRDYIQRQTGWGDDNMQGNLNDRYAQWKGQQGQAAAPVTPPPATNAAGQTFAEAQAAGARGPYINPQRQARRDYIQGQTGWANNNMQGNLNDRYAQWKAQQQAQPQVAAPQAQPLFSFQSPTGWNGGSNIRVM